MDEHARGYLAKLRLNRHVSVQDGRFSTTALSDGQRKRLTLVVAYLEDRPVLLFDEWSAGQEPDFKRFFYTELLPELRDRGKTVIVISHDEQYFGRADRVVRLESGQIVRVSEAGAKAEAQIEAAPLAPFAGANVGLPSIAGASAASGD